jgi:uncharacterized protein (DUF2235 family)
MRPKGKRIAMFLDGTWNTVRDNTNIWRLRALCSTLGQDGAQQVIYYDEGVGTRFGERMRGGMFGFGLDRNVVSAYRWLIEAYSPGDDVFVFGFSRGAYTARSLTGLIAKCGLLQPGAPLSIDEVFSRYQKANIPRPLYQLQFERRELRRRERRGGRATDSPIIYPISREEEWLLKYSQRIQILFTGVFDTVGALGVPFGGLFGNRVGFHNTRLSNIYKFAYQALAIDEHRRDFRPSVWTKFTPSAPNSRAPRAVPTVEQCWFIGAHANVGGGYVDNRLAQIPLAWLVEKAVSLGLTFRYPIVVDPDSLRDPIVDSYSQFARGLYKVATWGLRHYRVIGLPQHSINNPEGVVETVNETIDGTVFDRWRADGEYRPPNLIEWASRRQMDPSALVGSVNA